MKFFESDRVTSKFQNKLNSKGFGKFNWTFQLGSQRKSLRVLEVIFGAFLFIGPLMLVLLVLLGGCKHIEKSEVTYKRWEPDVTMHSYPTNLKLSRGEGRISHKHRHQIRHLVQKATLDSPVYARVMFNVPENHASRSLHQSRLSSVKSVLNEMGIENHRIEFLYAKPSDFVTLKPGQNHHIIVAVDQYDVKIPECPEWKQLGYVTETQTEQNFGCVTMSNLSHMIAEPRDLYRSVRKDAPDGPYNANIVAPYREGAGSESVDSDAASSAAASLQSASSFIE